MPSSSHSPEPPDRPAAEAAAWLERFHAGEREIIDACYRQYFATVSRAIGSVLGGADRETVIHELFARLIGRPEFRRSFDGGSFEAWIRTVAHNQAIDYQRRLSRETQLVGRRAPTQPAWEEAAHARMLVERFRRERLPPEWQPVFELRFLQQLPQREAAARLSMLRTTLAYRERRIKRLLEQFVTDPEPAKESP